MRKFYAAIFLFYAGFSTTVVAQKTDQTITFNTIPEGNTFGTPPLDLIATSTSGLTVSFSSSDIHVAEIFGNLLVFTGGGEVIITATQAGNASFNAAPPVRQRIFVQKGSQSITFPPILTKTYGNAAFAAGAWASSSLPITYTSSDPSVASIVNGLVQINRPGEVQITASQLGDAFFYFPATSVTQTLTIGKAAQWVSIEAPEAKGYGHPPFMIFTLTASGLPVDWIRSQYDSVAEVNGNMVTIRGAGTTQLTAYQSGDERYHPGYGTYVFTVAKVNQTITFGLLPTQNFGGPPLVLNASSNSGQRVTFRSSRETVASVAGNEVVFHAAGSVNIIASVPENENYLPLSTTRSLTITSSGLTFPVTGTTRRGGNGRGTVFAIQTDGTGMTNTHVLPTSSLSLPNGGLLKASDGKLYGVIGFAGTPANGVIFSMNGDGTGYTVLHNFSYADGSAPSGSLIEATNGYLYGVTTYGGSGVGVIYRIKKDGTDFSVLHEFTGTAYNPMVGLFQAADGKLYGTVPQGGIGYGALYVINADGTGFNVLVSFDGPLQGATPRGVPLQGADLFLYGVTSGGGSSGNGVIYKVKTDGTSFSTLHHFNGTQGSYGSGSLTLASDGKLYGMTQRGGANDKGTLFSVLTNGTAFTKLLDLDGTNRGAIPLGSLIESANDAYLYGMTSEGGSSNLGVTFKVMKDGTGFVKLLDFIGANGSGPWHGPLLETTAGVFMGMTYRGSASDAGLIFSVTAGGTFSPLKDFPQPATTPETMAGNDDVADFVGLLSAGGTQGAGALFTVEQDGSGYTPLMDLPGGDFPFANKLMVASDNSIWGIGREGVSVFSYFLFRVNGNGTGYQRIYMNDPAIGMGPVALVEGRDGYIYGAASNGGAGDHGTVFRLNLNGTGLTHVVDVPGGSQGSQPSHLIVHSSGVLYGVTSSSGFNEMVIFRIGTDYTYEKVGALIEEAIVLKEINGGCLAIGTASKLLTYNPKYNDLEIVFSFLSSIGTYVQAINQTVDGYILVALRDGGANGYGSLIKVLPDASEFTKLLDFNGTHGAEPNSLLMKKEPQQITSFDDIPQKEFLDPPFALQATTSSGATVFFTSSDPTVAEVDGYEVTIRGVGTATIHARIPSNGNYAESAELTKTLTVVESNHQFTFDAIPNKQYRDPDFRLVAGSASGNPISFTSSDENVATVTKNWVTIVGAGITTITATIVNDSNFDPASPIQQTLTVLKEDQVIQFDPIGTHYVDAAPYSLSYMNASGLPVTFFGNEPSIATVAGAIVTPVSAGAIAITASAAGDANHHPAASVERTALIDKHDQTLVFDAIPDQPIENATFEFFPPYSSFGFPVALTTTSTHVSISGSVITMTEAGQVTLIASHPGSELVNAATEVSRTFCIIPARPAVTIDMSNAHQPMLTSDAPTGNEWLRNNVLIAGSTGQTLTPTQSGSYTVRVNIEGCVGPASEAQAIVVVGLVDAAMGLAVYPNPASGILFASLSPLPGQVVSSIEIHSLQGAKLIQVSTSQSTIELDIKALPTGLYLLKVEREGRHSVTKFVKQ